MKIYSDFALKEHPKAKEIIEWIPYKEACDEHVYFRFRLPQSLEPNGWFRNMKVIRKETVVYEARGNWSYDIYHITYEREHIYYMVEIEDNPETLLELLKPLDSSYGLINKNDELWIEMIGE